jgi:hypothetical protein
MENYKFVEVDYKAGSEDVLYALRETFRDEVPELDSDAMTSLAENYSMEQTLDVIKAFGQELSKSYLLFTVEDDSDSYVMTIIPRADEDNFVSTMKDQKKKATCMLQPRKKAGSPAKRFDFGKQLKGKIINIDSNKYIQSVSVGGIYCRKSYSSKDTKYCDVIYFDPQPVIIQSTTRQINCMAEKDGCYAICFTKLGADPTSYIAVGNKLEDISSWETISKLERDEKYPTINRVEDCIFYGSDLFLVTVNRVFRIKNAMNGGSELITVLEFPVDYSLSSGFFIVNDTLFVLIQGKIFEWSKRGLFKKEGFKKRIFEMESSPHASGNVFVINDEEVAFAEPKQFARSSEIQTRQLIILNVRTLNVRKVECYKGSLCSVEKGKVIVLCSGHVLLKEKKDLPLMVIMDLNTGEQKTLPYGCLGSSEIKDIYLTRDKRMLLETDRGIICPENLEDFLK